MSLDDAGIYVRWTTWSCNRFELDLNYGFVSSCTYLRPFMYMYKVREREQFRGWVNNDESLAPSAPADDVTAEKREIPNVR